MVGKNLLFSILNFLTKFSSTKMTTNLMGFDTIEINLVN